MTEKCTECYENTAGVTGCGVGEAKETHGQGNKHINFKTTYKLNFKE